MMQRKWFYAVLLGSISALGLVGCQTTTVVGAPIQIETKKDPEKAIQTRIQLAAEYIRSGDLDAAKRTLDQALQMSPRNAEANMMMGVLLQTEGSSTNMAKADQYYRVAVSADPKNPRIRLNYGTYLFLVKKYTLAIENLKIAGTTLGYEQRAVALENLGMVYLALNDLNNAEQAFKQSLQADRNGSPIIFIELAEIFYLQKDFNSAIAAYEQFTRSIGNTQLNARALWIELRIARAFNDKTKVQILANQMRALYPDSAEYQRYLKLKDSSEVVWK